VLHTTLQLFGKKSSRCACKFAEQTLRILKQPKTSGGTCTGTCTMIHTHMHMHIHTNILLYTRTYNIILHIHAHIHSLYAHIWDSKKKTEQQGFLTYTVKLVRNSTCTTSSHSTNSIGTAIPSLRFSLNLAPNLISSLDSEE